MDLLAVNVLLPLDGLLLAVLLGWMWPRRKAMAAAAIRPGPLSRLWDFSLRYVLPVLLGATLLAGVWA